MKSIICFFVGLIILGVVLFYLYPDKEGFGGGRRNPREGRSVGDYQDDSSLAGKGPYGNPLTPSDIYDDGYNYYPIYKYYRSFLYDPYFYQYISGDPYQNYSQGTYGWVPGGVAGCPLRQGCYVPKSRWWYW